MRLWLVLVVAAVVGVAAAAAVSQLEEASAYHDGFHPSSLEPHHTVTAQHYSWERHWHPRNILINTEVEVGYDADHLLPAIAATIEHGLYPNAYLHMPNQNGSIANVSLSNASAYASALMINATAPHEAAGSLPVRTDTLTVLAAGSAPAVPAAPYRLTPYHAPATTAADLHTAPTGHYPGVSNPRHLTVPEGASQVYVHNAGLADVNVTIAGLDGSDHSQLVRGSSSHVLPVGDYNYSITAPGYALAWNGTIRQ